MDYKVTFSTKALNELAEITKFIAQDNPESASELADKLVSLANGLSRFPSRHAKDSYRRGIRKMPAAPYLIYYAINENKRVVTILHFWHGARQHPIP
jgi:plasmid stabilization system protein ParE